MPFPLAHPAAVLPLRRYCPRWLNFPALVIGSISPDIAYLFRGTEVDSRAHTFAAGTLIGLLLGLAALALCVISVRLLLPRMTALYRENLLPLFEIKLSTIPAILISLVLGIWTHLLFDSFTHAEGWAVLHSPVLRHPAFKLANRTVRICHLLWYLCSFVGVALLVWSARNWREHLSASAKKPRATSPLLEAISVAALILPIEILHHLVRTRFGLILVAGLTAGATLLVLLRIAGMKQQQHPE